MPPCPHQHHFKRVAQPLNRLAQSFKHLRTVGFIGHGDRPAVKCDETPFNPENKYAQIASVLVFMAFLIGAESQRTWVIPYSRYPDEHFFHL